MLNIDLSVTLQSCASATELSPELCKSSPALNFFMNSPFENL